MGYTYMLDVSCDIMIINIDVITLYRLYRDGIRMWYTCHLKYKRRDLKYTWCRRLQIETCMWWPLSHNTLYRGAIGNEVICLHNDEPQIHFTMMSVTMGPIWNTLLRYIGNKDVHATNPISEHFISRIYCNIVTWWALSQIHFTSRRHGRFWHIVIKRITIYVITIWDMCDGRYTLPCKAKNHYPLTLQVNRYCLLALHSSTGDKAHLKYTL